jgi:hypothetical protein
MKSLPMSPYLSSKSRSQTEWRAPTDNPFWLLTVVSSRSMAVGQPVSAVGAVSADT